MCRNIFVNPSPFLGLRAEINKIIIIIIIFFALLHPLTYLSNIHVECYQEFL